MSLLVVAALALVFGGVMAWLVRAELHRLATYEGFFRDAAERQQHQVASMLTQAEERHERISALVRELLAAEREQRERLLDRIEAPGASAAREWHLSEAPQDALAKEDREWLDSPESVVPWSEDLALADSEVDQ